MKFTGIVRRIDDLGRIVIPRDLRKSLKIKEGDAFELFIDNEGNIILKKYMPSEEIFNKDILSNDKKEILIDSIQFYKNEVLKANGNNYDSFTIMFLNSLLKELKEGKKYAKSH